MRPVLSIALVFCLASTARAAIDPQAFAQIEHGRYLAIAGDCAACHTAEGGAPYAGGKPIETPFGTLRAPNITPDKETGIGAMTDETFLRAMREGIGRGGRHLYPAMPYPYFTRMSRADLRSIRSWLNTLEPQRNAVQVNELPFPFRVRAVMRVWNQLYFNDAEFKPDPAHSAIWNRGAWLVEGPGHCGACHTPKTALGGDEMKHQLQGGVLGGWLAPSLTADRRIGVGAWSEQDIVAYLQTGHNARAAATGPMAEVVADSTSKLTKDDLAAIAAYLKSVPSAGTDIVEAIGETPAMQAGRAIYADNCTACHGADGTGQPGLFPALRGNAGLQATQPTNIIQVLLHGGHSVATDMAPTGPAMPAFGWKLSDAEVAAVATFIRNNWGNAAAPVEPGAVRGARQN